MKNVFEILWRLAVLSLPWQTRWFWDAELVGWPWEQGRISIYVSWFFIFLVAYSGFRRSKSSCHEPGSPFVLAPKRRGLRANVSRVLTPRFGVAVLLVALSIIATRLDLDSLRAVGVWWGNVFVLALFVWSLRKNDVRFQQIAVWLCISLLPHALLGMWQFVNQEVIASTMLGIASQVPSSLGVSVVESDGVRTLRAYGGFPHPNIFGGWLVMGSLAAIWLATRTASVAIRYRWTLIGSLYASVLVLTFSRSAMLAFGVATCVFLFCNLFTIVNRLQKRAVIFSTLFILAIFGATIFLQNELIITRVRGDSRLEMKSIESRVESGEAFVEVFHDRLWIGTGPNAELKVLAEREGITTASAPLEPPHNVYLLALVNFGIIGTTLIILIILSFRTSIRNPSEWILNRVQDDTLIRDSLPAGRQARLRRLGMTMLIIPLLIIGLFDHYPWTLWSGQVFVALTLLGTFGNIPREEELANST